jgi:hypothetical protein
VFGADFSSHGSLSWQTIQDFGACHELHGLFVLVSVILQINNPIF